MSKVRFWAMLSLIVACCTFPVIAQEEPAESEADEATLEALVDAIRANRKALVSANIDLTDEEAAKFWPLYDRYQKEMNAIGDRVVAVVQEYTQAFPDIPNDKALKLIEDFLSAEDDRVKVRRKYVNEFAAILPGRKVARFYQIENKMDAVVRYDLAATIPVVEENAPAN